jgi:hypothetical protein
MLRISRLPGRPRVALAIVAALSMAVHALLALTVHSLLFFPDEWLYAGLSRSFLTGHPGQMHGGTISIGATISYAGPVITSPLWFIDNVAVAYHLSQLVGSLAFASAVFPTFALARRLGVGDRGSLVAAVFSQLIPAGIYTATLLTEPYAYPAFLAAVLVAVEGVTTPTPRRTVAIATVSVGLCLVGGLQFLFFPVGCVAAWIAGSRSRVVGLRRSAVVAASGAALFAALGTLQTVPFVERAYATLVSEKYSPLPLAGWLLTNVFVLAVSSGLVVVPVAVVGIARLLRSADRSLRAFSWLVLVLITGMLLEAAIWGTKGQGVYERFTFYAAPLLTIMFLKEIEGPKRLSRVAYAAVAYALAAAVLLAPLVSQLFHNIDHSPTMQGLAEGLLFRIQSPPAVWAPVFALLAVGAALVGAGRGRVVAVSAAGILLAATTSGMQALGKYDTRVPRFRVPAHSALIVNPIQENYAVNSMDLLFWNPNLDRLVILNGTGSPDGVPATEARLQGPHLITTGQGARIRGPFAVPEGTTAWSGARLVPSAGPATVGATPTIIAFGWGKGGLLYPFGELLASISRTRRYELVVSFRAIDTPADIVVRCDLGSHRRRVVTAGFRPDIIRIPVPASAVQRCTFGFSSGRIYRRERRSVVARARLVAVRPILPAAGAT